MADVRPMAGRAGRITDPARLAAVRATGLMDTPRAPGFDRLTGLAAAVLGTPYAFATLVDGERSFWKSAHGIDSDDLADRQNTVDESFCQYVVNSGEALIVGDAATHPVTKDNPSIECMGVAAWAGFPLVGPTGHPLGSFCVVDTVTREWTDADIEVLRALAAAAADEIALHMTMLEAREANARMALLAEAGQTLAETLHVEGAAQRLVRLVVPILGDWAIFALAESDATMRDIASWHRDARMRSTLDTLTANRWEGLAEGASVDALRSNKPVLVESGVLELGAELLHSELALAALRELAPESSGAFPLTARGQVIGVLAIARGADRAPLSPAEQEVAAAIAQRAGLAVDNARLYAEQLDFSTRLREANDRLRTAAARDRGIALALQEAILPRLPHSPDVELIARYQSPSGQHKVGGDWYDAIVRPDGATVLVVGDVAGHDIAAAAAMGQLHNMLRAFAWDRAESPAALLTRFDEAMRGLVGPGMVTVAVVLVEPAEAGASERTLRWSIAGHPRPILRTGSAAEYLDGQIDPPLGIGLDVARTEQSRRVPVESTVLLYTDGLIDTPGDDDLAGRVDRLLELVGRVGANEPAEIVETVLAGLGTEDVADDVALLAARLGSAATAAPA